MVCIAADRKACFFLNPVCPRRYGLGNIHKTGQGRVGIEELFIWVLKCNIPLNRLAGIENCFGQQGSEIQIKDYPIQCRPDWPG